MLLTIIRIFLMTIISIIICILGIIYCLFSPCNPNHAAKFGSLFSKMSNICGITIETRSPQDVQLPSNCIYVINHQNNYDLIMVPYVIQPRTITIGKKSLLWVPLFGILYWLTGNIFINRKHSIRAYKKILTIVQDLKKRDISICIFPEGTRNPSKNMLLFKTGAFYAAIATGIPIVPICIANNTIKLHRWSNGKVIIETLPPIITKHYDVSETKKLTKLCQDIMQNKLNELNEEVLKII